MPNEADTALGRNVGGEHWSSSVGGEWSMRLMTVMYDVWEMTVSWTPAEEPPSPCWGSDEGLLWAEGFPEGSKGQLRAPPIINNTTCPLHAHHDPLAAIFEYQIDLKDAEAASDAITKPARAVAWSGVCVCRGGGGVTGTVVENDFLQIQSKHENVLSSKPRSYVKWCWRMFHQLIWDLSWKLL